MPAKIFAIWIICYLIGAVIAPFFELSFLTWLLVGCVLCGGSFFIFQKRYFWAILFGLGAILLSIAQFQYRQITYQNLNQKFSDKNLKIVAYVTDLPTPVEHGKKVIVDIKTINSQNQPGKAIIYIKDYPEVKFSDEIKFEGKLKKFDQKQNRLIKDKVIGETSVTKFEIVGQNKSWKYKIKGVLFSLRTSFNEALKKALPKEEASLASGLILGEKSLISPEFTRDLQNSGTSHIIALSGYNITIILSLFIAFQMKLSRRLNLVLSLVFIIFFVVMTGAAASVVRAGIMGFMPVLAKFLGRSTNSFMAVILSAFLMTLLNPFVVLYDVGFQLSFAALCGMIYLGPILSKLFKGLPDSINFVLAETLGAQIATLPLLLFYFGRVSIISPISNLVVLSLVPLGMLVSFLVGIGYLALPVIGEVLAIPSYVILHLFYLLISFFGHLPFASTQLKIDHPIWLLMAYLFLLDIVFIGKKHLQRNRKEVVL